MHRGFVKLWRKSLDSPVWKNPDLWRFWSWCLLKAAHNDFAELVGFQCVALKPGEFVFGRKVAARETGLSEQTIRTCIATLQKLGNLTITSTNKFSILTIEKWDDYQATNQQATSSATSKQPAANHIQEHQEQQELKDNTPLKPPHGEAKADDPADTPKAPPTPRKRGSKGRSSIQPVVYSESFEAFWAVYPLATGKAKAFESWEKIPLKHPGVGPTKIIQAIKAQVEARHFDNLQGESNPPHPTTWLNQARWDDVVRGSPGSSSTTPTAGMTLAQKLEWARTQQ